MISSIDIIFCEDQSPTVILAALQKAGWQFGDDAIEYELYADVNDVGLNQYTAPLSELARVTEAFGEALRRGEKASVHLSWPDVVSVDCTFFSLNDLHILFFVGPRLQEGCGRFTDFSRLLRRIVCPLEEAGCTVFSLICTDHFD